MNLKNAIAVLAIFSLPVLALGQTPQRMDWETTSPTEIRASAVLTALDVRSTTFSMNAPNEAYVAVSGVFTSGSLTSVVLTPGSSQTGQGAAAAAYTLNTAAAVTITSSAWMGPAYPYVVVFRKEDFGSGPYLTVTARGVGTVTNSLLTMGYKFGIAK